MAHFKDDLGEGSNDEQEEDRKNQPCSRDDAEQIGLQLRISQACSALALYASATYGAPVQCDGIAYLSQSLIGLIAGKEVL